MLKPEQRHRYKRNIMLEGIGEQGQEKLLKSRVLIVGAGGLGSAVAYYLAAAGVGHLGLVDGDLVDLSNLQRQILYQTGDLGKPKAEVAKARLEALNPDLEVEAICGKLDEENAHLLISRYDLVVDCTDNFVARFIINDTCLRLGKPFVHGAVSDFSGQVMTIIPGAGPCFRCIFPKEPKNYSASDSGVLSSLPGTIGTVQATEVIKYILGLGDLLVSRLLVYDALSITFSEVSVARSPCCPVCSENATGYQ
ncbi:MAG: UBA/THIF-type NAD/FAD binding protein [Thermacetogenium phaeum]|uniref:UBA/THIF-type NAD/FAD binding protein n=1 Tax=Thermacetogenium phaeum TaxID=85874 RepID=A0A101FEY3_9THEO|nr:MAG: UBA/THIF-type NAD/FAD binding protein [Thermacetogenium phaeum]